MNLVVRTSCQFMLEENSYMIDVNADEMCGMTFNDQPSVCSRSVYATY